MHEHTLALSTRLQIALSTAFGEAYAATDPQLRPATRPEFGHLQTNLPFRLAKELHRSPRQIATELVAHLDVGDLCLPPQIAGAGFVNLTWRPDVLAAEVQAMLGDEHLGVRPQHPRQRIVIDYSNPNVAKQMHVGHLRSTVIGDALARVLRRAGHEVVAQNHIGDWGTQFGMLIEEILSGPYAVDDLDMPRLLALYQGAKAHFDADPEFAAAARRRVVALQSGDPLTRQIWQRLVGVSLADFEATYARLGVLLTRADVASESSYNDDLPGIVAGLAAAGLLVESEGAQVVFPDGFHGRDGAPLPLIVRKSDGGFNYATTDLAALRRRVGRLAADRIVYVVDHRQSQHLDMVFAVARAAGWLPPSVTVEHVAFGTVLGTDGRPFRTRSGETVSLAALLDAAEEAAAAKQESPAVVRAAANAAVKYADLSNHLARDYVFDAEAMTRAEGDTGPYLQYAHARVCSVLARAGETSYALGDLAHDAEIALAHALTGYAGTVDTVASTLEPHRLTAYLFGVATALSTFYEQCPVLTAEPRVRSSRLALCEATRRVLAGGLGLLGIDAPDRM